MARIAQDSFGQREAPIVALTQDTADVADRGLSGAVEVRITKRDVIVQLDTALQAAFAGVDRADRPFDADAAIFAERNRLSAARKSLQAEMMK